MKCFVVMSEPLLREYGIKSPAQLSSSFGRSPSIAQSGAEVSASLEVSLRSVPRSQELQNISILKSHLVAS